MRNNASFAYALLLVVGDFLAILGAFTVAYILRVKLDPRPLIEAIPAMTYFYAFATVLPLWILVHAFIGLYSHMVYERRFVELGRLLIGSFLGVLVVLGYDFASDTQLFPARLVPVYGVALSFVFLALFRAIARLLRYFMYSYGRGISNVLIIGDTELSERIAKAVANSGVTGQKVLGIVGRETGKFKLYSSFAEFLKRSRSPIHSIIQTELYKDQLKNSEILRYAQENHVAFRFVPGNTDMFYGNIDVELYAGIPMIAVHQTALIGWGRIAKRIFDVILSSLLLVVTLPITALMAFLELLTGGEVFFRQQRLTRFNREFKCYKFRTILTEYNGLSPEQAFRKMGKPQLIKKYRDNGDKLAHDPRYGRLGRFLWRTSLDELPQLWNVLKGDISLVGPRSLVPDELSAYEKRHAILSVKSGLTGLAQISGRRDIGFEERRRLDLYYVQNWSFWLDLNILARTIYTVIKGSGAK